MSRPNVERWINAWNRYWFPATTTLNLAGCRIIAVLAQVFWFPPSLEQHLNLLSKNSGFIDAQALIRGITSVVPRDALFTAQGFTALYWTTMAAGILALVGLFTRSSIFVFALGNWIFVSHRYSYGDVHHPEALFAIFLMTLAFAPSGASLSLDALRHRHRARGTDRLAKPLERSEMAMWPLKLAHVLLAMTYFSTGISKLLSGGLAWMNGYTVQIYTFSDAITRNRPLGIWLAEQHTLGVLLGAFTILFELFFFVSLVLPRTAPFFFLSGILFHVGLFVTSGHPFYSHIVLNALLLVFLNPEWFSAQVNRFPAVGLRWRGPESARESS
jgi:Vitamin K-dependent gamma-carboxylase